MRRSTIDRTPALTIASVALAVSLTKKLVQLEVQLSSSCFDTSNLLRMLQVVKLQSLAPGRDGTSGAGEIQAHTISADLVVMNGCHSGQVGSGTQFVANGPHAGVDRCRGGSRDGDPMGYLR